MSQFLVGSLNEAFWYLNPEVGWLTPDDATADAVRDLRVQGNTLSVYEGADNESKAHIERIVVAIAAKGKQEPVEVGYRLFDPGDVQKLGIEVVKSKGTLGAPELNGLHRDLIQISAIKLGQLAAVIAHGRAGVVSAKDFERILRKEVEAGRLALSGVNTDLRRWLRLG